MAVALPYAAMFERVFASAQAAWQPWLGVLVLVLAILLVFATGFALLRRFAAGVTDALAARRVDDDTRDASAGWLVAGLGVGSIAAGAAAIELGGPGALVWLWIGVAAAMALRYGEAILRDEGETDRPATRPLGKLWGLGAVLALVGIAGIYGGHETGALFAGIGEVEPFVGAVSLAVLAAPLLFVASARRVVYVVAPIALVIWVVILLVVVFEDPLLAQLAIGDAVQAAFGLGPATAGVAGGAAAGMAFGVWASTIAGGPMGTRTPARRGKLAWPAIALLGPLGGGALATTGALAAITEPKDTPAITEPRLVPLERHHSRGLRPSQQVGQTVVLPEDSPLESGKFYGFKVRGNPRGTPLGKLQPDDNAVFIPAWKIAEQVDTVVFRARDKEQAKQGGWDVRVPVVREEMPTKGGRGVVKLSPRDPEVDFSKLLARYELGSQPFVVTADYHFTGKVAMASTPDESLGEHKAMFEVQGADRPFDPDLHEFFRVGYRGPYADVDGDRPPWGFVGVEGYAPEIGSVVDLRLPASPRGEPFVRLDRAGGAESPPWDFLLAARELVIRHDTDPTLDLVLAVQPELDGARIRWRVKDPDWEDLRRAGKMAGYRALPFVRVADYDFQAEVHGDARLAPEFAGRRSLVALHELGEPQGPFGELPYHPHPGEVAAMGMHPPVLARDGAARIGVHTRAALPSWASVLAGLAALLLAVAATTGWFARTVEGATPTMAVGVMLLAAIVGSTALSWHGALGISLASAAIVVGLGAVAIVLGLGEIRRRRG